MVTSGSRALSHVEPLRWADRVYGDAVIDDPGILTVIACPTFQRLKKIKQAGPSALAYAFKTVTRYEHSLGVYVLLEKLGAGPIERLAGLLHDISHTAFSHAVDFIIASEEQDHHEELKPLFLNRPDLATALAAMGRRPEEFYDDSVFPLLERPIPWLCADRLDYFLRDGLACGVLNSNDAARILASLVVVDQTIGFSDAPVAELARARFAEMNRDWWASATEGFIYNEFAAALEAAFQSGVLRKDDLLNDDEFVLERLRTSRRPEILGVLERIEHFDPKFLDGYHQRIEPKERWLDPPVLVNDRLVRLSELG